MNLNEQPQQCGNCNWAGTAQQMVQVRKEQCKIPYFELACPKCRCERFALTDEAQV